MAHDPERAVPGSQPGLGADIPASGETYPNRVERLFREYNQSLLRFLRHRVRSYQEAKEIAQEAYVRLLKLDNPGTVSFLQAYLFKTAANIAAERFSQQQTRDRCNQLVFFEDDLELAEPAPERQCAAQQELDVLRCAVEQLPEKYRTAFVLNRIEELSLEETAARMNLHPRHVRRLVAEGLAHCLKRLSESNGPSERDSS